MGKTKKTVVIRVKKVAPKRLLIEQRRKFLWFWQFWQKGCPSLGLNTYYSNKQVCKTAIHAKAEKKNVRPVILFM